MGRKRLALRPASVVAPRLVLSSAFRTSQVRARLHSDASRGGARRMRPIAILVGSCDHQMSRRPGALKSVGPRRKVLARGIREPGRNALRTRRRRCRRGDPRAQTTGIDPADAAQVVRPTGIPELAHRDVARALHRPPHQASSKRQQLANLDPADAAQPKRQQEPPTYPPANGSRPPRVAKPEANIPLRNNIFPRVAPSPVRG